VTCFFEDDVFLEILLSKGLEILQFHLAIGIQLQITFDLHQFYVFKSKGQDVTLRLENRKKLYPLLSLIAIYVF
jgi:hypothetical protein